MRDMRTIFICVFWLASLERKQDILKDYELQCVLFIIFVKRDYLTEELVRSYSGCVFFNQIYYVLFILIMESECLTASVYVCVCVCVCMCEYCQIWFCFILFWFFWRVMENSYLFLYCLFMCVFYVIYSSSISLFSFSLLIPTTVFVLLKFSGAKQLNING